MNTQIDFLESSKVSTTRVFRYPGSKSTAAKYFVKSIPSGVTEVVSPFFGGGSFEMFLTGRNIRVHGSDLFEPLVNLWNQILTNNKRLAWRAEEILMGSTKESLKEYQQEEKFQSLSEFDKSAYLWLFYCLSWNGMPFKGIRNYFLKGRDAYLQTHPDDCITFFDRLESFQNHLITVELRDYRAQLKKFPSTFAYLDPPYPDVGNLYGNSAEFQDSFDHEELRDILKQRDSLWMLSYNDKPIIQELYSGPEFIYKVQWWKQGTNTHKSTKEVVIFPKTFEKYLII